MTTLDIKKLSNNLGAEVLGVDTDRLLRDDGLADACMTALEKHGVLLFRKINVDDRTQVEFCRKLGTLINFSRFPPYDAEEVMEISFDPSNPNAEYLASNDFWHIDGLLDKIAPKASVMSARVTADRGGETEFASTYAAYEALSDDEKKLFADLRVVHTFAAIQRLTYPDPTPTQLKEWASRREVEHPLVWQHESGRQSLVFGATTSHVVGMDFDESRALLDDLEKRATTQELVYRHTWSEGDLVIWDNSGLVHRACEFDRSEPRRMHRSTLVGHEIIK